MILHGARTAPHALTVYFLSFRAGLQESCEPRPGWNRSGWQVASMEPEPAPVPKKGGGTQKISVALSTTHAKHSPRNKDRHHLTNRHKGNRSHQVNEVMSAEANRRNSQNHGVGGKT